MSFAPGEQKTLKSRPPRGEELWEVEIIEETATPEDHELKKQEKPGKDEEKNDDGGEN